MTITEALKLRIPRVRQPQWGETTYLRLPIFPDGTYGPWAELYDDVTQQNVLALRPGSQRILTITDTQTNYLAYTGPVSPFEQDAKNFARAYAET